MIEQVILDLEKEIEDLQYKLNTRQTINCPHIMCEACANEYQRQEIEYSWYTKELDIKIGLLNKLKTNE